METGQGKERKKRCVCKCVLLFLTILLLSACVQGCDRTDEKAKVEVSGEIPKSEQEILLAEAETAAKDYQKIYKEKPEISLKEMVEKMGKRGYIIIDENNQTNLQNPKKLRKFCEEIASGREGTVRFYRALERNGIRQTDLTFDGTNLIITNVVLSREKEDQFISYMERYAAKEWKVTEKGYLIYKKYRPAGYDGEDAVDAVRMEPIPDELRELCKRYVPQSGYYN